MGINPADRKYFTVNVGELYRLARLPMGWSLIPFYFCKMTLTFVNFMRAPDPEHPIATAARRPTSDERAGAAPGFYPTSMTFCYSHQERKRLSPTPRQATRPSRSPPPPNQRFLDTAARRTPPACTDKSTASTDKSVVFSRRTQYFNIGLRVRALRRRSPCPSLSVGSNNIIQTIQGHALYISTIKA
jgi:hypothetical protein